MSRPDRDPALNDHPLTAYFTDAVRSAFRADLGVEDPPAESYVTRLLVHFLSQDALFALRDAEGRRLRSVAEMVPEGDILQNAPSFERERLVHRHIGDFLLFWSGMFPEHLRHVVGEPGAVLDPVRQGQESYHIVSTFDHAPYEEEASLFRRLSDGFDLYRQGLSRVRSQLGGLAA